MAVDVQLLPLPIVGCRYEVPLSRLIEGASDKLCGSLFFLACKGKEKMIRIPSQNPADLFFPFTRDKAKTLLVFFGAHPNFEGKGRFGEGGRLLVCESCCHLLLIAGED